MKTAIKTIFMLFAVSMMSISCKNPNATQETDGQSKEGATPAEVSASATDTTAKTTTTRVNDLEGSDSENN